MIFNGLEFQIKKNPHEIMGMGRDSECILIRVIYEKGYFQAHSRSIIVSEDILLS